VSASVQSGRPRDVLDGTILTSVEKVSSTAAILPV
jgi:hypothetical protein